jgi:hypothetical protein
MKTIKVIQRKVRVNHKYGPSSIRYMLGRVVVCSCVMKYGNYKVHCTILGLHKVFDTEKNATQYCENKLMPHFLKMLQHGI